MPKIFTWQTVLTSHQLYTYKSFEQCCPGYKFLHIYFSSVDVSRVSPWPPSISNLCSKPMHLRSFKLIRGLTLLLSNRNSLHFFASPFENISITILIFIANLLSIDFYVISEPYNTSNYGYHSDSLNPIDWFKRRTRPYLYYFYCKFVLSQTKGIFTISEQAYNQYIRHGVPSAKLFPFGYFYHKIHKPSVQTLGYLNSFVSPIFSSKNPLKIIYIGSAALRKGVAEFISYVKPYKSCIQIDLYGDQQLQDYDCPSFVKYCGSIDFGDSPKYICQYHFLVLPSHYDGWGFVVSEAIASFIPVIASSQAGASILVQTMKVGFVFDHDKPTGLIDWLTNILLDPLIYLDYLSNIQKHRHLLHSSIAGKYLAFHTVDGNKTYSQWAKKLNAVLRK